MIAGLTGVTQKLTFILRLLQILFFMPPLLTWMVTLSSHYQSHKLYM